MPKRIIQLSDAKIRKAKPQEKQTALFYGGSLFILITSTGGKLWRLKYRFDGKEKLFSYGAYPEVSITMSRLKRDEAERLLAKEIDPAVHRKLIKTAAEQSAETFDIISREWHWKFKASWTPGHAATIVRRLEQNVFPWIGTRPIGGIKAPELLSCTAKD